MNYEDLTEAEKLHFENELLKVKLQVEYNAPVVTSGNNLPPEIENAFLNNVYNFQKMYENTEETSVYEYIGKPPYKRPEEILPEEFDATLKELLGLMHEKGIGFDFLDNCYQSSVLYKFIVEELFDYKGHFPNVTDGGGHWVFIYEEFHPNHAYDLNRNTLEFIGRLLNDDEISPELIQYTHLEPITLNGHEISTTEYLNKIIAFKSVYPTFCFSELHIEKIDFDIESKKASVYCRIQVFEERIDFSVHFEMLYGCWYISELRLELV